MIQELDVVVLRKSMDALGLRAGAVGTVVLVHSEGTAFEVEFLGSNGNPLAVATLTSGEIELAETPPSMRNDRE